MFKSWSRKVRANWFGAPTMLTASSSSLRRRLPSNRRTGAAQTERRRYGLLLEPLERRELLSNSPSSPITDMTQWAQAVNAARDFNTYGSTVLYLNFDGWQASNISPFIPQAGHSVDQDIQEILFRTSEIFAPFRVLVGRLTGDGIYSTQDFNTTIFIGASSGNV